MYQNVLLETKQALVLIRCLILVSHLTFLDFVIFGDLFLKIFISRIGSVTGSSSCVMPPCGEGGPRAGQVRPSIIITYLLLRT